MRCLAWGLNVLLAALLLSGCGSGTQQIVKQELDRYNMKSYQEGSDRQLVRGTTLNGSLLNSLQAECANRGIRLTHETYAEALDGGISYNYFINGDARHFLILNVYPSEQERVREISEIYGPGTAKDEAYLIETKGKVALVYASSGQKKSQYSDELKNVFQQVLQQINEDSL
jgi:hypothetical protein